MAYFAVVKDRDNRALSVTTCHLNLWVLPGFWGHYCQFDVGLRVKAEEDGLTAFLLALPFIVRESGVEDLHDLLLRNDTAPLVFGEPVLVQGTQISYGGIQNLTVGRIHTQKSKEVAEWTDRANACSVWKLELASALMRDDEQYLRLRFPIGQLGRRWVQKRTLFAENGAIMDFRVADIREAQEAKDWASLQEKIVPIGTLNAFVITPVSLQARSASPDLRYTRLLEGNAWEPYIRRRTGLLRSQHLLIFYWKANDISIEKPFRGFLDLSREFGVSSLANHVRTGVVTVMVFAAAIYARHGYAAVDAQHVKALLIKLGYPAGGLTLVSVLVWLSRHREPAKKIYNALRRLVAATDRRFYRRSS
ncbi:MAG: hypothetical protein WB992_21430 [Bryobacteraceae bacterium]